MRGRWEALSVGQQKRYLRSGIGKAEYESGASLAKARGHGSAEKENIRRRYLRRKSRYAAQYAQDYGLDYEEVRDALNRLSAEELAIHIEVQQTSAEAYMNGDYELATEIYGARNLDLPPDMNWYHGPFHGL